MVKAFAQGERLSNSFRCSPRRVPLHSADLRLVRDYLRRRFAHFELGAHFLDLRGLLFELGHENSPFVSVASLFVSVVARPLT